MEQVLKGRPVAAAIKKWLARQVQQLKRPPALGIIRVGDDPASQVYVRNKLRAARAVGMQATEYALSASTTEQELQHVIAQACNQADGVIVQLPLPPHLSEAAVLDILPPDKDVDGFTPDNLGRLARGEPRFISATPLGIALLLNFYQIPLAGKHVVVVGRSNIVGTPLSLLLSRKFSWTNATVTLCHSGTQDLPEHTRRADVVVVAVGRPQWFQPEWLGPETVLVDVGIHRQDGQLVGDVHPDAYQKAAAYTPVPGGVGPLTVASLLFNVFVAYQLKHRPDVRPLEWVEKLLQVLTLQEPSAA